MESAVELRNIRYRLLPGTRAKHHALMRIRGACRHVWNHFLAKNEREYFFHTHLPWMVDAPSTTFFSLGKQFTEYRRNTDWLQQLPYAIVR